MKSSAKNNTANNIITVILIICIIATICGIAGCSKKLDANNKSQQESTVTYTVQRNHIDGFNSAGASLYYVQPTYMVYVQNGVGRSSTAINLYYHGEPLYYNPDKQTFFVYTDTDILTIDKDVLFAEP